MRPKILLHICCAPDATVSYFRMKEYADVTGYFNNSNIHPEKEYFKRLREAQSLSVEWDFPLIEGKYDPKCWYKYIKGFEKEKEGGLRCSLCIYLNLLQTAEKAKGIKADFFTTSLTASKMKDLDMIRKAGEEVQNKVNIPFYFEPFRKNGGFDLSVEFSLKMGLYRQNYCGCIFSMQNRKGFKDG